MNTIKNIHKLTELSPDKLQRLEVAASLHKRHSRIEFKIQFVEPGKITIRVTQDKNPNGNHFTGKELAGIAHKTFDDLLAPAKVVVNPIAYVESPVNDVNAEWINAQMSTTGIRLKDMIAETGIAKAQLARYINETDKEMSQTVKAFFYYYFKSKTSGRRLPILEEK